MRKLLKVILLALVVAPMSYLAILGYFISQVPGNAFDAFRVALFVSPYKVVTLPPHPDHRYYDDLNRVIFPHGYLRVHEYLPPTGINAAHTQAPMESVTTVSPVTNYIKTARPIREVNPEIAIDTWGYPILANGQSARLLVLHNYTPDMVDTSKMVLTYVRPRINPSAFITYKGFAHTPLERDVEVVDENHERVIDYIELDFMHPLKRLEVEIASSDIRQLALLPYGGVCKKSPIYFVHETMGKATCGSDYQSFLTTEKMNQVSINPRYLMFHNRFGVTRYMNTFNASPSASVCYRPQEKAMDKTCLSHKTHWQERDTLSSLTWGGTHLTPALERIGAGMPYEVMIAISNELRNHPWVVIPHTATDDYVKQLKELLKHLKTSAYIELSNEVWNGTYLSHHYWKNQQAGEEATRALRGYMRRAQEVFTLFQTPLYGDHLDIFTVIGSHQNNPHLTRQLVSDDALMTVTDLITVGGYFYACFDQSLPRCKEQKTLEHVTTVDEVLDRLTQPDNPYGIDQLAKLWQEHNIIAKAAGKGLIVYEGGQHLTVPWGKVKRHEGERLMTLFRETSNNPRMGDLYRELIAQWRKVSDQPFVHFTAPEGEHHYGAFSIVPSISHTTSEKMLAAF